MCAQDWVASTLEDFESRGIIWKWAPMGINFSPFMFFQMAKEIELVVQTDSSSGQWANTVNSESSSEEIEEILPYATIKEQYACKRIVWDWRDSNEK